MATSRVDWRVSGDTHEYRRKSQKHTQRGTKKNTEKKNAGNTASAKDAFVDVAASARDVLCAARGGRGELGVAARVARSARAPFAPFCAALSTRLADELRDKAHAFCAAADYADAEAHQEEADAVPEAYLGAVAGTVRRCSKLLESLEDELRKPSAGQATDDAGRSETEASDGDDVALDDTPPRHLPEGVVHLRAAFDDVIEALSAAYGARERDWLENALERVVRRLPEGDDYASLLEGPLQGRAVAEAAGCLERSLTRCRRVAAPRRPCGRVSRAAVDAVLAGKSVPVVDDDEAVDPAKALAAMADDFVRDRLLAPALDAAAASVAVVTTKRRPSVFQTDDGGDDGPPPAFYDVVRAARVAATSWRGRLAVLAPRLEASDAAAAAAARALDAAAQRTADGLGEALGRARQSGDYAMRDEPSVLKPTKATVAFRDALLQRAAAADHAFAAHDDLLATWRKSLAAHASRAVEAHLTSVKVSRAGAFVLARDLDEIRKGAAPLGSNEADARFSRLREGVGVFELDAEQLAYVALKPGGAFASLPRDELVRRILRRADAWNFRGKRAKWVEELVASLEAS